MALESIIEILRKIAILAHDNRVRMYYRSRLYRSYPIIIRIFRIDNEAFDAYPVYY